MRKPPAIMALKFVEPPGDLSIGSFTRASTESLVLALTSQLNNQGVVVFAKNE